MKTLLPLLLLISCATSLPKLVIKKKDLNNLNWYKAQNTKKKLFIMSADHAFLKHLSGSEVKLRESSFTTIEGVMPKVIKLKYDLLDCPTAEGFQDVLLDHIDQTQYKVGDIQFTNLKLAGCGFTIFLKSNFFDRPSIFGALKTDN